MAKIEAKVIELTPEQEAERTRILTEWQISQQVLEAAKADEMAKRKLAFPVVFGENADVGTNRVALGGGWAVKGVRKLTVSLDKDMSKVATVDMAIRALNDPEANELASKILKRIYDLSESAWRALDDANPTHVRVKQMLSDIVTTKDAAPTLEIEPPKES